MRPLRCVCQHPQRHHNTSILLRFTLQTASPIYIYQSINQSTNPLLFPRLANRAVQPPNRGHVLRGQRDSTLLGQELRIARHVLLPAGLGDHDGSLGERPGQNHRGHCAAVLRGDAVQQLVLEDRVASSPLVAQ
jgi:hypothetical protein